MDLHPATTAALSQDTPLYEQMQAAIFHCENVANIIPTPDLTRIIPILSCNAHRFDHNGSSCGLFLRIASAFNHSCDPNCSTSIEYSGGGIPRMAIHTNCDVPAGTELTISYVSLLAPGENGTNPTVFFFSFSEGLSILQRETPCSGAANTCRLIFYSYAIVSGVLLLKTPVGTHERWLSTAVGLFWQSLL